jgi:enoyl-CoA hydratase/carnithine racemase
MMTLSMRLGGRLGQSLIKKAHLLITVPRRTLVDWSVRGSTGILTLTAPPVNALSAPLLSAILKTLSPLATVSPRASGNLENPKASDNGSSSGKNITSLLITSANPNVFSAGLDLKALLHDPSSGLSRQEFASTILRPYLSLFQSVVASLLSLNIPTATLISGSCPAGGTVLSLCTDYRVLVTESPRTLMGLTEVAVGMAPPAWVYALGQTAIPPPHLPRLLSRGLSLTDPKEILDMGLVHCLVPTRSEGLDRALEELQAYECAPWEARIAAKTLIRSPVLQSIGEETLSKVVNSIAGQEFQETGRLALARLKKPSVQSS